MKQNEVAAILYTAMEKTWALSSKEWDNDQYIASGQLRDLAVEIGDFMTKVIERMEEIDSLK